MEMGLHEYPPPPEGSKIERAPREILEELQSARLQSLVRRTWEHVPFYRKRWEMDGLTPEEITGIKDLIRLPIISKKDFEEDLLQNPPFGTYQGDFPAIRIQASSGTRGKSKPFFQTQHDWNVIANFWARRLSAQGVKPGDIVQIVFTYSLFIAGFTATEGAIRLGALVVPSGSGAVTPSERQVGIAKDWGTTVLVGTPTYILHLADVAEKMGLDTRKDFHLRISVHTAEALTEAMRRAIEERWKVQAYDSFGSVETGAPTFECEEKNGYHINEDGYLFEILDPKTLKPVPAGKDGLIVVTSLFKEAAPVIRYNLEDISSFVDEPCPCGRTLKRLAKIRGRLDEMIKIRGVAFYPTVIESILERWPQLTSEYLLILDRVGNREKATLKVEHSASDPGKDNLKEKLERDLKVATGLSIEAELLGHGELKRVLNMEERIKAKRVVDRRNE